MTTNKTHYSRTGVYLEHETSEPKHMFVYIADIIARYNEGNECFALLDVGAANGAFIRYMLNRFPAVVAQGLEYDSLLVDCAHQQSPGISILVGDVNDMFEVKDAKFDVVTMTGTHSIFEDFRPSFSECIRVARNGGIVIVTGIFNSYPVDALIHWRYGAQFDASWHPGYNLFSKLSVSNFLEKQPRVLAHKFLPFKIPIDIGPREDPIRSWTEASSTGERILRNAIMPLNFEVLIIEIGQR